MRPLSLSPVSLRKLLLHDRIATLPDLKRALGTDVDLTVFRKLKQLDYLTSYSHRGRFYTLPEIAHFGADGVCSAEPAWSSRHGTLLATAEAFIRNSVAGYFAEELSAILHVGAQDVLRQLVQQNRIAREPAVLANSASASSATAFVGVGAWLRIAAREPRRT